MADTYEIERCVLTVALRLAQKRGMSKSELGRTVFPGKSSGYRVVQSLLKPAAPNTVSRPRGLKLSEAIGLAEALGLELSDLIALAEKESRIHAEENTMSTGTLGE